MHRIFLNYPDILIEVAPNQLMNSLTGLTIEADPAPLEQAHISFPPHIAETLRRRRRTLIDEFPRGLIIHRLTPKASVTVYGVRATVTFTEDNQDIKELSYE